MRRKASGNGVSPSTLRICSLQYNLMQDDSALIMLKTFTAHSNLRALRLTGNPIGMQYIEKFEDIGKHRSATDIKEIMKMSISSLPPVIVSPGAKPIKSLKLGPSKKMKYGKKKSGNASPLSSPLVLSPYLMPSPKIDNQNKSVNCIK